MPLMITTAEVVAHGVGSRQDLPIPFAFALVGAAAALVVSFLVLAVAWREPRFRGDRSGRPLPAWVTAVVDSAATQWALRVLGLVLFGFTLMTATIAPDDFSNPTAGLVFVVFWLGLVPASLLFGPVWRVLNPLRTIHLIICNLIGQSPEQAGLRPLPRGVGFWPAAAGLLAFAWLELVAPDRATSPVIRVFFAGYLAVHVVGTVIFGSRWLDRGDAFEVFSGLFGRLSPFGRHEDGRIVVRNPLANLDGLRPAPGLAATVCVLLGSTAYDSLSNAPAWVRWCQSGPLGLTLGGTVGLIGSVVIVYAAYVVATNLAARLAGVRDGAAAGEFAHAIVPIVAGYFTAHYFTLLIIEGQRTVIAASDPFSNGSDWFGTAGRVVDQRIVQDSAIVASIQVLAIVVGHVLGVISAHDRAVRVYPAPARRAEPAAAARAHGRLHHAWAAAALRRLRRRCEALEISRSATARSLIICKLDRLGRQSLPVCGRCRWGRLPCACCLARLRPGSDARRTGRGGAGSARGQSIPLRILFEGLSTNSPSSIPVAITVLEAKYG